MLITPAEKAFLQTISWVSKQVIRDRLIRNKNLVTWAIIYPLTSIYVYDRVCTNKTSE